MAKARRRRRPNPVARALRRLRPKVVPSAKAYRRRLKHAKHKGRPADEDRDGPWLPSKRRDQLRDGAGRPALRVRSQAALRRLRTMSMISAAAVGMWVPGP